MASVDGIADDEAIIFIIEVLYGAWAKPATLLMVAHVRIPRTIRDIE